MINAKNFGIAAGIVWGLGMLITTFISMFTGYADQWLALMGNIYPGYSISWWGCIVGFIYGFIDAFVGLFLLAWFYNKLNRSHE